MRNLRVYIKPDGADTIGEQGIFYSRRADGPFYRWRYDGKLGCWRFARVRLPLWTLRRLAVASWQTVPSALQARLDEHYLE